MSSIDINVCHICLKDGICLAGNTPLDEHACLARRWSQIQRFQKTRVLKCSTFSQAPSTTTTSFLRKGDCFTAGEKKYVICPLLVRRRRKYIKQVLSIVYSASSGQGSKVARRSGAEFQAFKPNHGCQEEGEVRVTSTVFSARCREGTFRICHQILAKSHSHHPNLTILSYPPPSSPLTEHRGGRM
jgi:hypothetical protein